MDERKTFANWVKKHKTSLFIAGATALTVVCGIAVYKNRFCILETLEPTLLQAMNTSALEEGQADAIIEAATPNLRIVEVERFVRNLPEGWHPSAEKVKEAADYGVVLLNNQTLVDPHQRCYKIA